MNRDSGYCLFLVLSSLLLLSSGREEECHEGTKDTKDTKKRGNDEMMR